MSEFSDYAETFQSYMKAKIDLEKQKEDFEGWDFDWHYSYEINRVNKLEKEAEEAFINLLKATINTLQGE